MLLVIMLTLAFLVLIGVIGILTKRAHWKHIPLKVAIADCKKTIEQQRGEGCISKAQAYYAAFQEVWGRGEWEQTEDTHKVSETVESRFVDRWGKMFDGYHAGGWWFGELLLHPCSDVCPVRLLRRSRRAFASATWPPADSFRRCMQASGTCSERWVWV